MAPLWNAASPVRAGVSSYLTLDDSEVPRTCVAGCFGKRCAGSALNFAFVAFCFRLLRTVY